MSEPVMKPCCVINKCRNRNAHFCQTCGTPLPVRRIMTYNTLRETRYFMWGPRRAIQPGEYFISGAVPAVYYNEHGVIGEDGRYPVAVLVLIDVKTRKLAPDDIMGVPTPE